MNILGLLLFWMEVTFVKQMFERPCGLTDKTLLFQVKGLCSLVLSGISFADERFQSND